VKVWGGFLALYLGLNTVAAAGEAVSGLAQPYELVRSLQSLQDKIATGSTVMQDARPALMNRVADNFKAAPDSVWQDMRNQRAAVIYLLNGGDRNLVRGIYAKGVMTNADTALLEGALAYVGGDLEKAAKFWEKRDVFTLPASLASHVAFARAALALKDNPQQAIRFLDIARLLAPGTLIEEAAIRRELSLLRGEDNAPTLLWLATQYMQRFGASLYADEVRKRLVRVLPALLSTSAYEDKIFRLLLLLPDKDAMQVYLMAAGYAVTRNKVAQADHWAGLVLAMPGTVGIEKSRALLYRAAARVNQLDYVSARAALDEADPRFLVGPDAQLRQAVQAILALNPSAAPPLSGQAPVVASPPTEAAPENLAETVQALLAGTDRLLTEHKP